jgi:hypothetical protein
MAGEPDPTARQQHALERRLTTVLDALTVPQAQLEMLRAFARPAALDATMNLRGVVSGPNIVGIGIAEKVSGGQRTGQLALTVYVEQKRRRSLVPDSEIVPPALPPAFGIHDAPTDVVELGRLFPEAKVQSTPIEPGFSIGHPEITAGTLGAVVGPAHALRVLSNSHVLAKSGLAVIGDSILYPGTVDGGAAPADIVAHLDQIVPFDVGGEFVNRMDAAVATVDRSRWSELRSRISELGIIPRRTAVPRRNMAIVKVGRTTGLTRGRVTDVNFRFTLDYDGLGSVGFMDQALCTRYTEGGDSGSLVLEEESSLAVGLHFAGAKGGSVFSPIRPILRAFHTRLVRRPLGEGA